VVRRFESSHTGKRIADLLRAIIDQWKIPHYKIFRSLTDNVSNIVRAFNLLSINEEENDETTIILNEDEHHDDSEKLNSESETSDDEEVSV